MSAAVLGMIVLAVGYQVQTTTDEVAEAAGQAARAASMTASPAQARATATATARTRLLSGSACRPDSITVTTDTGDFRAGGSVQVTVACATRLPIGGSHRASSIAREVIDRYRGGL